MTAAAFLDAILAEPDDDSPRLVCADWLDERADPRGELIRVQCELARWQPNHERRQQLRERERLLLERHGRAWLGPLAGRCQDWAYERGLARLTIQARRFAARAFAPEAAEQLRAGWVGAVRLQSATRRNMGALSAATHLGAVGALDLGANDLDDVAAIALSAPTHVGGLTQLSLAHNRLTDVALPILDQSRLLERLRILDLRNNRLTSGGVRRFLETPLGRRLRRLEVHGNDLDAAALADLEQWRGERAPTTAGPPRRLVNSVGLELTLVPPGSFLMGSPETEARRYANEGPRHLVTLTRPFYLGTYPVTQRQYQTVMGANPSGFTESLGGGPHHPVEQVSWRDGVAFCRALSERPEERRAGRVYRLPTEAEWEHACRSGTETPFWFGDALHARLANFDGNYPYGGAKKGPYLQRTTPVGCYPANGFGLYDLHGNVWEWCADAYRDDAYPDHLAIDPTGPARDERNRRPLRGGSWIVYGLTCRSSYRYGHAEDQSFENMSGFRVALSTP